MKLYLTAAILLQERVLCQNNLKDCSKEDPSCDDSGKLCIKRYVANVLDDQLPAYVQAKRFDSDLVQGKTNYKCYPPKIGYETLKMNAHRNKDTLVQSFYTKMRYNLEEKLK